MKRLVLAAMFAVLVSSSLGCNLLCCKPLCGNPCGGGWQNHCADACADDCGTTCDTGRGLGGGCDWGCGERYWSDWHENPSPCCEPCDQCGNWTGPFNHPPMSVGNPTRGDNMSEPTPVPPPPAPVPQSSMKRHRTSR